MHMVQQLVYKGVDNFFSTGGLRVLNRESRGPLPEFFLRLLLVQFER